MTDELVETWRNIIVGSQKSWALFENGTCVILMQPQPDLSKQAIDLMQEWGKVITATPAADFTVISLSDYPGWVVTCHHPDILNYVSPDEFSEAEPSDVLIGLMGREQRRQDAEELKVRHVEDKR